MGSASAPTERVAIGYRPTDDGTLKPDSRADPVWLFAAGGVFSTAEDLLRFGDALKDDRLLSEPSKTLMWTPVKDTYGYGWNVRAGAPETLNRRVRMHSGRSQGYTACFVQFVDDDITGIVLSNNVMADTCIIIKDLTAIELGEPYSIPIARRAIKLDHAVLDRYAGRYHWSENYTLVINREGDLLVAQLDGLPDRYQLYPESSTRFFLKTVDVVAEFQTNRRGETTQLVIRSPTQEFSAKRLADRFRQASNAESSRMCVNVRAAPAAARSLAGTSPAKPNTVMPAAQPASTPLTESSITAVRAGAAPMRSAASRNTSGAGLPSATSVPLVRRPSNRGRRPVAPSVACIFAWSPLDAMQYGTVNASITSRTPSTGCTCSRSTRSRSAL